MLRVVQLVLNANQRTWLPQGLYSPCPAPSGVLTDLTMDFVEGLPKSRGRTTIFVVDWLTKYVRFMGLGLQQFLFSVQAVALLFLDNVFNLYGNPTTITSDRGAIFLSNKET